MGEDVSTFLAPDAAGARKWAGKIAGLIHRNRGARTALREQEKAQRKEQKRERRAREKVEAGMTAAAAARVGDFTQSGGRLLTAREISDQVTHSCFSFFLSRSSTCCCSCMTCRTN